MKTYLTVDLTGKQALLGSSPWSPPAISFGEYLTLALQFQQTVEGDVITPAMNVQALEATVGNVDARPLGGSFSFKLGTLTTASANTTPVLPNSVTASALAAAINALSANTYGTAAVSQVDGSFLIIFGAGGAEVPFSIVNNTLWPLSIGRCWAWQNPNGIWIHELRLTQAPVAFTDSSAAVLPDPPTIKEVQAGGSDGTITWNEIQSVYVPPNFAGTYQFKMGFAVTSLLSTSNSPADIQAALTAAFGNGFNVTNPLPYTANIEFVGAFAGEPQALLQIIASNAPPGDLTFTLWFGQDEMKNMLRANASVTLPLEVRITNLDEDNVAREFVAFTLQLTINRGVYFDDLATVPEINWLIPPSPKSYIPFNSSQVITGQQFYQAVIGNGAATSFPIAHGLNTEVVFVFVRQNISGGAQLVDETDFSVVINSANQVTVIALTGAPAASAWAAYVMSAQTVAAFAAGLSLTIGQVVGLETLLNSLWSAVSALQALLPTAPLNPPPSVSPAPILMTISPVSLQFPAPQIPGANTFDAWSSLLPSVGTLTDKGNTSGALAAAASGNLGWQYEIVSPGAQSTTSGNRRGRNYEAGLVVVSNGRSWFSALIDSGRAYAVDFEKELYTILVTPNMLVAGTTFTTQFSITLSQLGNCKGYYKVILEFATMTGPDIGTINWASATQVAVIPVLLSDVAVTHTFGFIVPCSTTGALSAQALVYSKTTVATAPGSASFAFRARLSHYDTEAVANPCGQITAVVSAATAQIA